MIILKVLVLVAVIGTLATLVMGISSMSRGGEFDDHYSGTLMFARVGFQGLALLCLLAALFLAPH